MKKTDDSKVSFKILELVLRADRCDIGIFDNYDNSALYYALLILSHPKFTRDIESIRNDLMIELIEYPHGSSLGDVMQIPWYHGPEKYQEILRRVIDLIKKYNLWDNWIRPLTVYVVSGVLPVAYGNEPIVWYPIMSEKNVTLSPTQFALEDDSDFSLMQHYYGKRTQYPSIALTEKLTSKNQLKGWIDENWNTLIEPELINIPSRLKKSASIERLAIGLWLWEMRDLKKMGWEEIDEEIRRVQDKNKNIWGDEKNDLTPTTAKGPDLIYSAKQALSEFYPL